MLDYALRRLTNPILDKFATPLVGLGISANMITLFGIVPAVLAFVSIWQGYFYYAIIFILLNRFCDGLDGCLARRLGATGFGAYIDIVADFFFYGLIPLGFVMYAPLENAVAGCFLLFSFLGSGSSFMMFAVLGYAERVPNRWGGEKGFYFVGGLIEGGETILMFLLFCLFADLFVVLAFIFGCLCWVTVLARVVLAYKYGKKKRKRPAVKRAR